MNPGIRDAIKSRLEHPDISLQSREHKIRSDKCRQAPNWYTRRIFTYRTLQWTYQCFSISIVSRTYIVIFRSLHAVQCGELAVSVRGSLNCQDYQDASCDDHSADHGNGVTHVNMFLVRTGNRWPSQRSHCLGWQSSDESRRWSLSASDDRARHCVSVSAVETKNPSIRE